MTAELIYLIGTLILWGGWAAIASAILRFAFSRVEPNGPRRIALVRGSMTAGIGGAVALVIGGLLTRNAAAPAAASGAAPGSAVAAAGTDGPPILFHFPIVWPVMPWTAWIATAAVIMIVVRVLQSLTTVATEEKKDRLSSIIGWAVALVISLGLYFYDHDNKVTILKGAIPLTLSNTVAIVAFAAIGIAAMAIASQSLMVRGASKLVATQAALLAGSVVFGLPFLFLLVTSFKEDKDMSSPNGIVWIPKVQQTIPYSDPENPHYLANFEGRQVDATVIEKLPNGKVRMEVFKPLSIRGTTFDTTLRGLPIQPQAAPIVDVTYEGMKAQGFIVSNFADGRQLVELLKPENLKGKRKAYLPGEAEPYRLVGLRWQNYSEALDYLPPETNTGLVYLKNTLILVITSVIGTILSSAIVAYAFSRMRFPGRNFLFTVLLSTMMLPGAVLLLPQFLIFRTFGWIDTLYPLWVPAFFGSAFNIFLLRQFFMGIPMELEDAAKIDGCSYLRTFWSVMIPQIKPALAVIAIWTFMGAWNNFMGPLIYVNSPENMPLSYALQLFQGDRSGEPGLMMAFATMTILPVLGLFFFTQRYFIEGVTLSGLGGR